MNKKASKTKGASTAKKVQNKALYIEDVRPTMHLLCPFGASTKTLFEIIAIKDCTDFTCTKSQCKAKRQAQE